MTSVSVKNARQKFASLVRAAQRGRSVAITRRGKKVARIVPAEPPEAGPLPSLAEFRASIRCRGKGLSEIVVSERRKSRY
ncbi:MAG: type II toxin-antitoxin system prevent-host-death family antitoxin [Planctomycetes bacterium]|nr:type II toxin-antitoxin system prevent-host-death family antitoxin [Planctomycetota bacterium]